MKVYTEVNYIWKDDKLVQTDSKSYEYEGDVEQCHKKWHWHTHASIGTVTKKVKDTATEGVTSGASVIKEGVKKLKDTVSKGPTGGTPKDWADKLYGGDTKAAVTSVQETYKDFENSFNETKDDIAQVLFKPVKDKIEEEATSIITANNSNNSDTNNLESNYHSGDSSASTEAGGYKKNTRSKQSRGQMNLTSSKRKSLLTS